MSNWFLTTIGVLGFVSAFLIVAFVAIRSILEIGHMYGFLPRFLKKAFIQREENIVNLTLERLGITQIRPELKELMAYRNIDASELANNYVGPAKALIKKFIKKGTYTVGRDVYMKSKYYIFLREVLTDYSTAMAAGRILVAFLRDKLLTRRRDNRDNPIEIDLVVGHRDGSPLLAASVAHLLRRQCALYGERRYVHGGANTEQSFLEGENIPKDGTAIIVDDSTTDGHMLIAMANTLRRSGISVKYAFVIFNRVEGGAKDVLESNGITLHSILPLRNVDLEPLVKTTSTSG